MRSSAAHLPTSPVPDSDGPGIDLWVAPIPPTDDGGTLAECLGTLPRDDIEAAGAFRHAADRRRHVASRAVLRAVLSRYSPVPPRDWQFARESGGRPVVRFPATSPLRFSLSHTRGLVALAVTRGATVGVDAEEIRPLPDFEAVVSRSLTRAEIAHVRRGSAEGCEFRFLTLWTLKEAYLKALGTGLSVDPRSVEVLVTGDADAPVTSRPDGPAGPQHWNLTSFVTSGHVVSVAAPNPAGRIVVATVVRPPDHVIRTEAVQRICGARVRTARLSDGEFGSG